MKRDINLMVKRSTDVKAAKSILFILLFLAILSACYYFGTSIPAMIKSNTLIQKADLDQQLDVLSKTKEKFDNGVQTKNQLLEAIELAKELEDNKKDLPVLLNFVEKACPREITLHTVKFGAEILELGGYAGNDLQVSAFLMELKKNEDFKTVLATQSVMDKETGKQDFTVTILFTVPLKAEPITISDEKVAGQETTDPSAGSTQSPQSTGSPPPANSK